MKATAEMKFAFTLPPPPPTHKGCKVSWVTIQSVIKGLFYHHLLRVGAVILISMADILLMGHPLKPGRALFFIFSQPILPPGVIFCSWPIESHCVTDKITASHWSCSSQGEEPNISYQDKNRGFGTLREPFLHWTPEENRISPHHHWTFRGKLHLVQEHCSN